MKQITDGILQRQHQSSKVDGAGGAPTGKVAANYASQAAHQSYLSDLFAKQTSFTNQGGQGPMRGKDGANMYAGQGSV